MAHLSFGILSFVIASVAVSSGVDSNLKALAEACSKSENGSAAAELTRFDSVHRLYRALSRMRSSKVTRQNQYSNFDSFKFQHIGLVRGVPVTAYVEVSLDKVEIDLDFADRGMHANFRLGRGTHSTEIKASERNDFPGTSEQAVLREVIGQLESRKTAAQMRTHQQAVKDWLHANTKVKVSKKVLREPEETERAVAKLRELQEIAKRVPSTGFLPEAQFAKALAKATKIYLSHPLTLGGEEFEIVSPADIERCRLTGDETSVSEVRKRTPGGGSSFERIYGPSRVSVRQSRRPAPSPDYVRDGAGPFEGAIVAPGRPESAG
jgi:hypothetical protein